MAHDAANDALQSFVHEGWFGSDAKKNYAGESLLLERESEGVDRVVRGQKARFGEDVGQSRERAVLRRAWAASASARARTTAGAPPAASRAASETVSGGPLGVPRPRRQGEPD